MREAFLFSYHLYLGKYWALPLYVLKYSIILNQVRLVRTFLEGRVY